MNKIFHESRFCFRSARMVSFIIVLVVTLSCFLSTYSYTVYKDMRFKADSYNDRFVDTHYYQLSDAFVGEYESAFFSSDNCIAKLKSFHYRLMNHSEFKYYESHENPIEFVNELPDDKFLWRYSEGLDEKGITLEDGNTYYQLNGVYLSENVFDDMGLSIARGEHFSQEDYDIKKAMDSGCVSVVLGHEFAEYYDVGDRINAEDFFSGAKTLKVVGILEQGSFIPHDSESIVSLDRYIVLPASDLGSVESDPDLISNYTALCLIKTDGVIASKHNSSTVQDLVNELCDELEISPAYRVVGAPNQRTGLLGLDMNTLIKVLRSLAIFIDVFSVVVVLVFTLITVKRNLKYYSILSVNGFTSRDIYLLIMLQPLYIMLCAFTVNLIAQLVFANQLRMVFAPTVHFVLLVVLVVLAMLVGLLGIRSFNKHDIAVFLRKR